MIFLRIVVVVVVLSGLVGGQGKQPAADPPISPCDVHGAAVAAQVTGLSETTDNLFKKALKEGNYPWYDSKADRIQPVWPVRISWLEWLNERVDRFFRSLWKFFDKFKLGQMRGSSLAGNSIGTVLLLVALMAFFACIFMLWVRRERGPGRTQTAAARSGIAARLGEIPDEVWPAHSDPWAEANRRRVAGDRAGAIICLFAHQLLTLDQMGLIRLAPAEPGGNTSSRSGTAI